MAFIDTSQLAQKPSSPLAWEALMAQIDMARVAPLRQRPAAVSGSLRFRRMAEMVLAAGLAAGLIIAVAGVMMLKLL